jgi:hypothetical protein
MNEIKKAQSNYVSAASSYWNTASILQGPKFVFKVKALVMLQK